LLSQQGQWTQLQTEVSTMPRFLRFAAAALSTVALTGCATMHVSSHVDRSVDFASYRTYDWAQPDSLPAGDARLDNNQFFQDYFQGAVERGLAARRFARTTHAPDLLIHYHASVTRQIDVEALEREYRNCSGRDCYPSVTDYEAATWVIDFMDARTNRLVWRAWAQDGMGGVIDDQDRLRERVEIAVAKMLERLPGVL
jgi:hypothetical protein